MTRSAADVRNDFLEFFKQRGHTIMPGSPVVPYEDPTLLFTNAGMNQFKDVFLGAGTRSYTRAADSQPCIRAGGKHNDLDDVGQDTYHHTFFEMLGNWSFGDYFKKEAIEWAWELLTDVWGLDKDRLHATYFGGLKKGTGARRHEGTKGSVGVPPADGDEWELEPDYEARDLWASVTDIDPSHIHPGSMKDNFWEMGDVGPCGPCSEIHIDLTPDKSGASLVNAGDARVIEIWNLVFIQFNRDAAGKLTPLPARHVDTGMGFERVCALLQGKSSNYDTDVFMPIFQAIRDITGAPPYQGTLPEEPRTSVRGESSAPEEPQTSVRAEPGADDGPRGLKPAAPQGTASDQHQIMVDVSYRVIADHARCLTFALNDGAVPDREGRGYVLRRILRRAVRYAWQYLDMHEPFLYKLVPAVVDSLGDAFPQLKGSAGVPPAEGVGSVGVPPAERMGNVGVPPAVGPQRVAEIIREEEESFDRTLDRGIRLFEEAALVAEMEVHQDGWMETPRLRTPVIPGEVAFRLHDTYGFPIDLTQLMAQEKGLRVDIGEFERLMEQARERAKASAQLDSWVDKINPATLSRLGATDDTFKYSTRRHVATLKAIIDADPEKIGTLYLWSGAEVRPGQQEGLVFDETCLYAEAGGQVGDSGYVTGPRGRFRVNDTRRIGDVVVHFGVSESSTMAIGDRVTLEVDTTRNPTMQNHTATHVMNWALREVLGDHVQQKGSLVDPEKTRFDFSHPKPLTPKEIERVEQLVNERIGQDLPVDPDPNVPLDAALSINGVRAVFGEKYPDPVRVVCCGVTVEELRKKPANPEWRKYPIELCGGTHCESTGQIERFAIVSEEAVAKGIRRVVGITGERAQDAIDRGTELLKKAEELRSTDRPEAGPTKKGAPSLPGMGDGDVAARASRGRDVGARPRTGRTDRLETGPTAKVAADVSSAEPDLATQVAELQQTVAESTLRVVDRLKLREAIADLQKLVKEQQKQQAAAAKDEIADKVAELLKDARKIGDTTIVVAELPDLPLDQLKTGADMIKQKCKSAAVLFAVWVDGPSEPSAPPSEPEAPARAQTEPEAPARAQGKVLLLAAISNDLVKKGIKAGDLIKHVAPIVDGRGGGPPTMAQAGGKSPDKIPNALAAGRKWIDEKLG